MSENNVNKNVNEVKPEVMETGFKGFCKKMAGKKDRFKSEHPKIYKGLKIVGGIAIGIGGFGLGYAAGKKRSENCSDNERAVLVDDLNLIQDEPETSCDEFESFDEVTEVPDVVVPETLEE